MNAATVQPRRNLLTALWMSAMSLWGATKAEAKTPEAEEPSIFLIVGRLCLQSDFRNAFFAKNISADYALDNAEMKAMIKEDRELRGFLKRVLEKNPKPSTKRDQPGGGAEPPPPAALLVTPVPVENSELNPIEATCAAVGVELSKIGPRIPCRPWPCG